MKMLPFFMCLLICLSPLAAESESSVSIEGKAQLNILARQLGRSLEDVVSKDGLPDEMYTVRGPTAGQDSVVFFYDSRISLFWAESHVWQVRADREFLSENPVLRMGMSRDEVFSVLGRPDLDKGDFLIYTLPQRGYPVSSALYFEEDRLSDLYVYRSDF